MSTLKDQGYEWKAMKEAFDSLPDIGASRVVNEKYPGFEGLWCRYIFANTYFQQLEDAVVITHGPISCVAAMKNFKETQYSLFWAQPFTYTPSTGMDEGMVIMGGADDLAKTLRQVDQIYHPSLIVVTDTCATAMIADDIENTVSFVQPEVKAKIVYTPSPGFSAVHAGKAMELVGGQTALIMDRPKKTVEDGVNVLGFYTDSGLTPAEGRKYPGDAPEFIRLIEGLGLHLHRIINYGNYEYIRSAPEAAINAINAPCWGYPLAQAMEKRFGNKWLKMALPNGLGSIRRWVMELAQAMGREEEAEKLIRKEEEKLMPLFEQVRKEVEGKALLVECARNSRAALAEPLAYARMGAELGMKPYLFNIHPMEFKASKDDVECFWWDNFNPPILLGSYSYESPVDVPDVMEDLGLDADQCVYIYEDVFPYAQAGKFDPCNVAKYTMSVQMKRVKGGSHRGIGYGGTAATYQGLLEAIRVAKRKHKPTFYGRIWSRTPFEFQCATPN